MPIGVPVDIRAEARGLLTRTRYNETPLAEEILENIRAGSHHRPVVHRPRSSGPTRSCAAATGTAPTPRGTSAPSAAPNWACGSTARCCGPPTRAPRSSASACPLPAPSTRTRSRTTPKKRHFPRMRKPPPASRNPLRNEHSPGITSTRSTSLRSTGAAREGRAGLVTSRKERGTWPRCKDILAEQARIKDELQRMETSDETPPRKTTGTSATPCIERWQELDEQAKPIIERMEQIKAITRTAADEANLERPGGTGRHQRLPVRQPRTWWSAPTATRSTPMPAIQDNMITRGELRERALDAIEMVAKRGMLIHDWAEEATEKVQHGGYFAGNNIARHILETGSQEYYDAFEKYIREPGPHVRGDTCRPEPGRRIGRVPAAVRAGPDDRAHEQREREPVPADHQREDHHVEHVERRHVAPASPRRGSLKAPPPATSPRPSATSSSPPSRPPPGSSARSKSLSDTDFGQQLPRLLADAKDRLEEAAFATGTGTAQPTGVMVGATTTVAPVTTGAYVLADVYAIHAALPPRFRNSPNCAWVANVAQINRTRALDTAGGSSFWTNLGKDSPEQLMGKPIYESSSHRPGADDHAQADGLRGLLQLLHRRSRRGQHHLRAHGDRHRRLREPAYRAIGLVHVLEDRRRT